MKATVEREPGTTTDRAREFITPVVNIVEGKDGYALEAEMPGVSKSGLEITLDNNELTIIGHRQPAPLNGEALFHESRNADYRRVFELDPAIDTAKISAQMEQGVLKLTLPKSERVKPRKITVD